MKVGIIKTLDRIIGPLLVSLIGKVEPARSDNPGQSGRILVIRPGGIGDAVHLIPSIAVLRQHYPDSTIDILAERRNAAVFGLSPDVRHVYRYDLPQELFSVIAGEYDLVIDTEQWHRLSAVVARLVRSPRTIGFNTNERGRLFTDQVPYSHDDYEADSFLRLLEPLGIPYPADRPVSYLQVPEAACENAGRMLAGMGGERFVAVFPGASIPERRWGVDSFRQVAEMLSGEGIPVVVVGGAEDRAAGEAIVRGVRGINLAGRSTLSETAALISRAALLVSGDSGILHIGVGLGIPTVSLFGPGIAVKWAPRGERHTVVSKGLACSPCTRFGSTPECPYSVRCMDGITADEVFSAAMILMRHNEACQLNKVLDNPCADC